MKPKKKKVNIKCPIKKPTVLKNLKYHITNLTSCSLLSNARYLTIVLMCAGATEDAINAARDALHAHLAATQKGQQHVQDTSEEDLSLLDEKELDVEFAGNYFTVNSFCFCLYIFILLKFTFEQCFNILLMYVFLIFDNLFENKTCCKLCR